MADIFDELDIFDQIEPDKKYTGNPSIDMASANAEQAKAQEGLSPMNILKSAASITGKQAVGAALETPGILANSLVKTGSGLIKGIDQTVRHPIQTLSALDSIIRHPQDALGAYVKGRYDTKENAMNQVAKDPFGTLLDLSIVSGGTGSLLKTVGKANRIEGLVKTGDVLTDVANAPIKTIEATGKASKDILAKAVKPLLPPTPDQLIAKAENIAYRILQPATKDTARALAKHQSEPAVREFAKVIKKSKNFQEAQLNIENSIKENFTLRNELLASNNYKMTDGYIRKLEGLIERKKRLGQINPSEVRQLENVLIQEKAWFTKNSDKFRRVDAQARKEYLQTITEPLLKAEQAGLNTEIGRFRMQALDELRGGLMVEIEGGDKTIRALNNTYAGLTEAKKLITEQSAILKNQSYKGLRERALLLLTNPRSTAVGHAIRNVSSLSNDTAKIEKLMQRAIGKDIQRRVKQVMLEEEKPILGIPYTTPKYLQERASGSIPSLGVKGRPIEKGVQPTIVSTGIPVPAPKKIGYIPKYIQERELSPIPSLGVKGKPVNKGIPTKEPIEKYSAPSLTNKAQTNQSNPSEVKQIFDESYENAIKAKKKRMMKY